MTTRSAEPMVRRCYRHQNPDAFGGEEVSEASVPTNMRWGVPEAYPQTETINEEPSGNPDARPL